MYDRIIFPIQIELGSFWVESEAFVSTKLTQTVMAWEAEPNFSISRAISQFVGQKSDRLLKRVSVYVLIENTINA